MLSTSLHRKAHKVSLGRPARGGSSDFTPRQTPIVLMRIFIRAQRARHADRLRAGIVGAPLSTKPKPSCA